jgi:putative tricarboxylic transport membrane protein
MLQRQRLAASIIAALSLLVGIVPAAAAFPERPITLIVPFAPGGPADTFARIVGKQMGRALGQPIIFENIAGAGGTTGIAVAAQAKPDGYTIMIGHMGTHGAAPAIHANLKYDPTRDFAPIGMIAGTEIVIVARKDFPASNLREFVGYVRKNHDKVTEAHGGIGSIAHTACALLQSIIGTRTRRVAYLGTGQSMSDLVAGQVDFGCDQITNVVPQVQAGTIKAFAIASARRSPALKEVPTAEEGGLPEFKVSAWQALFAPKGTPPDAIARLNDALVKALEDERTRKRLMDLGTVIPDLADRSPDTLQKLVETEVARWSRVLKTIDR